MRPPSVAVCSLVHLSDRPRWILDFHSLDVSWPLVRCQRLPPPVDLLLCAPLRLPPLPIVAVYVHRRRRSLGTASLSCRAAPRLAAPHLVATLVMTTSPATRATAPCELVLVGHTAPLLRLHRLHRTLRTATLQACCPRYQSCVNYTYTGLSPQ